MSPPSNLAGAAESYVLRHGWSIIPIYGAACPGREKAPPIPWKPYQKRPPREDQHTFWFGEWEDVGGMAVVTGRVSALAVLDFDSAATWQAFQEAHPHLTETRTTRTPNGWHLFFQLPTTVDLATDKTGQGIDLLVEGCYAILPPTRWGDQVYEVARGGTLHTLTARDAVTVQTFVAERHPHRVGQVRVAAETARDAALAADTTDTEEATVPPPPISEAELRGLYRSQAWPGNRNNALFAAALLARDAGWLDYETQRVLAPLHMDTTMPGSTEGPAQRYSEALRTIRSAYSRPPRSTWKKPHRHLPNIVKEMLLRWKYTNVLRVITGLRLLGVQDGEYVTCKLALHLLRDIVGEYSIRNAFHAITPDGEPLFACLKRQLTPNFPPSTPQTPDGVASAAAATHVSKCLETSLAKPQFAYSKKPSHWFQLPSDHDLCQLLDVEHSRIADPLTLDDLKTAKTTREAVHRELIRRAPAMYRSDFLAWRLGVSLWTKNRYDTAIVDLHKLPTYTVRDLCLDTLHYIPDFEIGGQFLQDDNGQRYPAQQGIAQRLLGQGRRVALLRQGFNYYYLGTPFETPPIHSDHALVHRQRAPQQWQRALVYTPPDTPQVASEGYTPEEPSKRLETAPEPPESASVAPERVEIRLTAPAVLQPPPVPRGKYRRKLRDGVLEDRANQLKRLLNALSEESQHHLSIVTARRLVHRYSWREAHRAYLIVKSRFYKDAVDCAPALLTVITRSNWKARQQRAWQGRF